MLTTRISRDSWLALAGIPLRKLATPKTSPSAVVFLAAEQAGHITMHDLYVDGGATMRA